MNSTFLKPLVINDGDWLNECPCCGGNNLHQTNISVYTPDAPRIEWEPRASAQSFTSMTRVTHVLEDGIFTSARVEAKHSGNPSSDRQGLIVEFWCEGCENKPKLAIFQHKGTTFIGWQQ